MTENNPIDGRNAPVFDFGSAWHTGIVVDDLEAAMHQFALAFKVDWAIPYQTKGQMWFNGEVMSWSNRVTIARQGPHHLELLQQLDHAPWQRIPGGRYIHHVGYWADDVAGASDHLTALGFPRVAAELGDDGTVRNLCFHQASPGGFAIEVVTAAWKDAMERWWNGGELRHREVSPS